MISDQSLLDIPNLIGEQKLNRIGFRRARSNRLTGGRIPLLDVLPFIFGVGLGVNHPRECAFERIASPHRLIE